jgi:hypothetical protein
MVDLNGLAAQVLSELGHAAAHKIDQGGVAGRPGGNQRTVRRVRAVIDKPPPRKLRHHAAGFVHQKVGRRKIPIVAAGRRKGGIERAMPDAGEPQR